MIDDVAVLGQLVVTTESCIFLAKGREATPCVSVPLTELKDVSPGAYSLFLQAMSFFLR